MNQPPARQAFLDELFDELDKKYKTPSPEALAMSASGFEYKLQRYVLMFLGTNAYIVGLLTRVDSDPAILGFVPVIALATAAVIAFSCLKLAEPSRMPTVLAGAALALVTLALLSALPATFSFLAVITWGAIVIAMVVRETIPQGSVVMFSCYLPLMMFATSVPSTLRIATEALVLIAMLAVFIRRGKKLAASCALAGAALAGSMEFAYHDRGAVEVVLLIAVFLAAAVIYEIVIRHASASNVRAFLRLCIPVTLIYLFVWSIQFSIHWLGDTAAPWWVAAGLVSVYQALSAWRDRPSMPLRLMIAALCTTAAVLLDGSLTEYWRMICLLAIAAVLQLGSIRARSNLPSNVAALHVLGVALHSLNIGISRQGAGVILVGVLTFTALLLLSNRPRFATTAPNGPGGHSQSGLVRRILLIVLGSFLRMPFIAWLFFWAKTFFNWLRYLKSPGEPLGANDLLFAAAHLYGAILLAGQIEVHLRARGYATDYIALALVYSFSVWGLVLVLQGLRTGQIYQRVLGLGFILVLSVFSMTSGFEFNLFNTGGALFGLGLVTTLCSWLVLRAGRAREPAADSPVSDSAAE